MFGKILFLSLLLVGCAKPNYQDLQTTPLGQQQAEGLRFQSSGLCVKLDWIKKQVMDESAFDLRFFRDCNFQESVDAPADFKIRLWMPDMNHGSSPVQITREAIGVYHVTNVYFIMAGAWEVQIQIGQGEQIEKLNEPVQL